MKLLPLLLLAGPVWAETAATGPECVDLAPQLDGILGLPAFEGAEVGILVQKMGDPEPLYANRDDDLLVPASNVKIVSTAAALHYLGPEYRFRTEVFGDMDSNGVVRGNLVVRGNGDPWLVPERIWYLANRLYYQGLRYVRGSIIIDDSYFGGPRLANGWEQDRSSYAYMAPVGAVSVGFNTMLVHVYPGKNPDDPAEVLIEPRSKYPNVAIDAPTIARGRTRLEVGVEADGDRSLVNVTGHISKYSEGRGYWRRVDNPPVFAGEVLKAALKQVGVGVRGRVRVGLTPPDPERIASIGSPRLAELVIKVNKHSNNFMAEQIARATGAAVNQPPGTWDTARSAIEEFMEAKVGIARGTYAIENASGLHDVNKLSARQIVAVLEYMYGQPDLRPEFVASLAVASSSGTLSSRMQDTEASGLLRAKTGTLSIASALSGYVTVKSGEVVAFSILINDYDSPIDEIWSAQDDIGAALAAIDFGCRTAPSVAHGGAPPR